MKICHRKMQDWLISSSLVYSGLIPNDEIHSLENKNKHYKARSSKTKTKIAMTEMILNEIVQNK